MLVADAKQNNLESWIPNDDLEEKELADVKENDELNTNFIPASQLQICSACYFIIDHRIGMSLFIYIHICVCLMEVIIFLYRISTKL